MIDDDVGPYFRLTLRLTRDYEIKPIEVEGG